MTRIPNPIDDQDHVDWHEHDGDGVELIIAVVGYLALVGIAVASVLYGLGYIG